MAQKWRKARITSPGSPEITLIAFGNALFSSKRGGTNRSQLLHKKLKEAEDEGKAVVVLVDEYNTSQVCSVCGLKGLKKLRLPGDELYDVLVCPNAVKCGNAMSTLVATFITLQLLKLEAETGL